MDGPPEDTICAIATPAGMGGIGIVRISGPAALSVAEKIVRLRSNQPLGFAAFQTLHLADILFPCPSSGNIDSIRDRPLPHGVLIDEGLVVFMKGPRSFTAEDVVEIHCHGTSVALARVCEACISVGARLAEPGEFTKRAFLNGRLDLSQAEAVLDAIQSKSALGLRVAQQHLRGELGRQVNRLRDRIINMSAQVEAGIDFQDEDISFIGREELVLSLQQALVEIQSMLATAETGRRLREGSRVVIVGRPNVGKSSLLNSLLRVDRAIVTDIPGTTRDVIEESVIWDGLMVTFVDTAGLRDTADVVEQEGMKRTKLAQEEADIVLHVLDVTDLDEQYLSKPGPPPNGRTDMMLINKSDLVDVARSRWWADLVKERTGCRVLAISVKTGAGLEELRRSIRGQLSQPSLESADGVLITNVRHCQALERAATSIQEALDSTRGAIAPECVAVDLRGAADALGEITGVITSDEILNRIFSEFCIGK